MRSTKSGIPPSVVGRSSSSSYAGMTTATLLPSIKRRSAYRLDPVEGLAAERSGPRCRDGLDPVATGVNRRQYQRPDRVRAVGTTDARLAAAGVPASGRIGERDHVLARRELGGSPIGGVVPTAESGPL